MNQVLTVFPVERSPPEARRSTPKGEFKEIHRLQCDRHPNPPDFAPKARSHIPQNFLNPHNQELIQGETHERNETNCFLR